MAEKKRIAFYGNAPNRGNWARGVLHKSAAAGAIVGSRNPARVNGATGAGEIRLTDGEAQEIEVEQAMM